MAAAENALQAAVAYEKALSQREAAAQPRIEPWAPDARLAPPGFAQPDPQQAAQPRSQVYHLCLVAIPPTAFVHCKLRPGKKYAWPPRCVKRRTHVLRV